MELFNTAETLGKRKKHQSAWIDAFMQLVGLEPNELFSIFNGFRAFVLHFVVHGIKKHC